MDESSEEEDGGVEVVEEHFDHSLTESLVQASVKVGPEHFEPLCLLGSGSFGEVYLVRKRDTGVYYAMKVLQKEKILAHNLVKYAFTERNVLSYTVHPFVVALHFAFQTQDKLVLILDYCPGGDLGKMITKEQRFSEDRAKGYLCEILLALEHLHKRNIIFRDLKPDNVVIDKEGHAMLTDFGLSKESVIGNQAAQSFCGSIAYLAPEMLKRSGHGKSVDWYLLGVLLYEMVVGLPPYFTNDRKELFNNIRKGPLMIPSCLRSETKDLIIKLLNKNPNKRLGAGPRDAEEIKEHSFFYGVNWKQVQQRQLQNPKPSNLQQYFLEMHAEPVSYEHIFGSKKVIDNQKLEGWSFINSSLPANTLRKKS